MRCQIARILPDAPDKGRAAHRQPWQAKEIDPLLGRHTAVMKRLAIAIEHIGFQPVESLAVPGGPDVLVIPAPARSRRRTGLTMQSGSGPMILASSSSGRSRPLAST